MSEIHIGPHTRHEDPHGSGETPHHHTFDREIDLKSIAKWMIGLVLVTLVAQVVVWYLVEGIERFDAKQDPELTPIQQEVRPAEPPAPRLRVGQNFERSNKVLNEGVVEKLPPAGQEKPVVMRSEAEDLKALRRDEAKVLDSAAWIDPGQGRLRVPIDVAMQVIASRGAQETGGATAQTAPPPPPAQPGEPAAGTTQQPVAPPPGQEQQR